MKKGISLFYILTLLLLVAQSSLFAGASLEVTPHDVKVQAGSEFTVSINLESDTSIMSLMAILQWDDSVIEPVEYIVPTEFDDPDNISTGWIEDSTMAIIGVAKMFANAIVAPYDGTIAQIKFKAKADAEVGDSTLVYLSLDSDLYQAADIGVQTVDMDPVQTNLTDGEVTIVKLFNVSSYEKTVDDGWAPGDFYQIPLGYNVSYTNENGDAYPGGGKVTALDKANITLKVGGTDVAYAAAQYGTFTLTDGNDGTVNWDGKVTAVIGHNALEFTIPFTATSKDGKYTATNDFTFTVIPQNNPPVISDFTVIAATEGAPMEFSAKIVDPEGDGINYPGTIQFAVGDVGDKTLTFNVVKNGDVFTFTSVTDIPFDWVTHTASDANVLANGTYNASWEIVSSACVIEDDCEPPKSTPFVGGSTAGDYKTWIKDTDQPQTSPAIISYEPLAPTTSDDIRLTIDDGVDEDGDMIIAMISWSNGETIVPRPKVDGSFTKKGEVWTPTVYTETKPYGKETVKSEEIVGDAVTIQNTVPTLAGDKTTMVVVKPAEATETKPSKSLTFTITDADADVEEFALVEKTAPAKGTLEAAFDGTAMTLTYTVNDAALDEFEETFTFAVKDSDDAESNALEITVQYISHQLPEIAITAPEEALDEVVTDDADAAKNGDADATTFTIEVTATDPNEEGDTGITSIELTVPEGWSYETLQTRFVNNNAATSTATFVVTTAGYDTIAGAERAASEDFVLTVKATDATGVSSEENINVTINDVDRVATAPTALGLSGDALHTGDTVSATPSGAEDADGDAVSYKVTLSVGGEALESDIVVADGEQYDSIATVKKGQVPNVKAVAVSKAPYAGDAVDGGELAADLDAVANTAPALFAKATITWEGSVEGYNEEPLVFAIENAQYENQEAFDAANGEQVRYQAADETIAAYYDIDEAAGADTVTITVDASGIADYATVEYADGQLTVTRIANMSTADLETLPTFKVIATDESGESAEVEISVEITPVNTKPIVEQADIYVLPSDIDGTEKSVTFQMASMGVCDYEDNTQKIAAVNLVSCEWAGVLTAAPTFEIAEDGKSFDVKYTMDQNAAAGTELAMVITVQDDGGLPFEDTSDEVTIKFIIGSTPWYPIYETDCEEGHDAHQLVITPVDGGAATTLIVEGGELRPADYYAQGCKGLFPGDYTVVAYAWTVADGAAAEPCYEGELTVPEYDVPGEASVAYADGKITVSAPLASTYFLFIFKDGVLYKDINKDFVPNEEGLIVPTETFDYTFSEEGTYTATIYGLNPKGSGTWYAETTDLTVVEAQEEVALAWPEDGVFTPQGVIYLNEDAKSVIVSFTWPVVNAAVKYALVILNSAAKFNYEFELSSNTCETRLNLTGSKANFNWYVIAIDADGNELSSNAMDFSLVQKTSKAVVEGISVENDGDDTVIINLIGGENISKVDIQIAHIVDKQVTWFYAIKSQGGAADFNAAEDGTGTVTIPGATISKGDIAVVRFYYTDGSVDKYTTYTVK